MARQGPGGEGTLRTDGLQLVPGQQLDSRIRGFHGCIQAKLPSHEGQDRSLFPWSIVMLFIGQVREPAPRTCTKRIVYVPQVGVLDHRRVPGPVATTGDEQLRSRRRKRGELDVVRAKVLPLVNRKA